LAARSLALPRSHARAHFARDIAAFPGHAGRVGRSLARRTEFEVRDLVARRAALVAVIRQRRLYAIDGHRSMTAYLRATVNLGSGDIARDQ
jgi:hypothetical protein